MHAFIDPIGASSISAKFIPTLLKICIGGTHISDADIHITAVVVSPHFADVTLATCLQPVFANVFVIIVGTALRSVSFTL